MRSTDLCLCHVFTGHHLTEPPRDMTRKAGATKSPTISVRQTDDGLHLANSILWFDSTSSGDLSFLSSASNKVQPKVPQVIATEETVRILEVYKKKPNALVCQYNRPFSIGRLRMELLPSGHVLGGASLYVETDKGRLLYAPQLQPHRIPTVRQMQLKRVNTLILGAAHADPSTPMPNRKREKERLLDAVRHCIARGEYPIVVCEPVATAQELTKLFCEENIPVAVHDVIFRINNVYESYSVKLGPYTRYSKKHTKQKVHIFPMAHKSAHAPRLVLPDGPIFYIEDTLQETIAPAARKGVVDRFFIASTCDGPEIKEIVAAVQPKELYIFGPYAKRYVEELDGACASIKPLFINDQPTLF